MKKLFLLLLGIASIPAAFSQGGSGIDWAADLDYLASELPANIATSLRNTTKRGSRPQSARSRLRPGRPEILLRRSKPSS